MSQVAASAPGKIMLIGEYAVLDGAPALMMAVDRRVTVGIATAAERCGRLTAPQLGIGGDPMRLDEGRLTCEGHAAGVLGLTGQLIPAIFMALGRAPEDIATIDIEIDSGDLFEFDEGRPVKLGLGSSAAVCAALVVALCEWFDESQDSGHAGERLNRWLPVYREALGARASGADLAAAFFGGFSRFQAAQGGAGCSSPGWPDGLFWRAVWSRQAAQTTDFVQAFDGWKRRNPLEAADILARLGAIAHAASENVDDGTELYRACQAYGDEMANLSTAMNLEIVTGLHRKLAEFGRQCGVVYKTCGAGGGDLGIALAQDRESLSVFEAGVSDRGGVPLNLAISDSGAGLESPRVPGTGEENR